MSESKTPYELERRGVEADILDAMQESEFGDTSIQEISDTLGESKNVIRRRVRSLRDRGQVRVTRTVGPAKLYQPVENSGTE
jgi:predicted ArsR family transcriptional regulator